MIDWISVWEEFENEINNRFREEIIQDWDKQKEIIQRLAENNLQKNIRVLMKHEKIVFCKYASNCFRSCTCEEMKQTVIVVDLKNGILPPKY